MPSKRRPRSARVSPSSSAPATDRRRAPTATRSGRASRELRATIPMQKTSRGRGEVLRVPVLADGADPGKTIPSAMAIRDRLVIDRHLLEDYHPDQLFAYDVTRDNMTFLRGLASPGDRIVFRRGGRVGEDRICAVRTRTGIVLARVRFDEHALVLLPGEQGPSAEPIPLDDVKGLSGVVAGTHVLLIRR